ncbi:MAG: ATP-grasp domain-containing protein [Planctomycetota bacterium]|nr:ATP-grasp domain-containing protein [Planctomycetota bacterium]
MSLPRISIFDHSFSVARHGNSLKTWSDGDRIAALELAERAAQIIRGPFLVIGLAKTEAGDWIIIECNDGQESGYAWPSPFLLWQNIVNEEKRRLSLPPD